MTTADSAGENCCPVTLCPCQTFCFPSMPVYKLIHRRQQLKLVLVIDSFCVGYNTEQIYRYREKGSKSSHLTSWNKLMFGIFNPNSRDSVDQLDWSVTLGKTEISQPNVTSSCFLFCQSKTKPGSSRRSVKEPQILKPEKLFGIFQVSHHLLHDKW